MKNIFEILKEFGLEIPEDKHKDFEKTVLENYKTQADYDTQSAKLKTEQDKVKTLEAGLEKFKDVDVDKLNGEIDTLKGQINKMDTDHKNELAKRDFDALVDTGIRNAKGKNTKAIRALLPIDKLMESKNQEKDIEEAIKMLTEAEDSKMLFGEPDPGKLLGKIDFPGKVNNVPPAQQDTWESVLAEHYKK